FSLGKAMESTVSHTFGGQQSKVLGHFFSHIVRLFGASSKLRELDGLSDLERADALFHNLSVANRIPGMAVSFLHYGETVLQKGYGCSDLGKKSGVDPERTLFRIASISKCITGLALGRMVEEGLIDLDVPFHRYVPDYPKGEHSFTPRQLAGHRAGIRGYRGKEYGLNQNLSIADSIELFKNDPLVFPPGTGYLYNSFDFVWLSLAMERASGISFVDYVRERVLEPLGMESTFSPGELDSIGEVPKQHKLIPSKFYTPSPMGFRPAMEVDNRYKLAGGGYLFTSSDIARLGQAILEGKLLQKETYDEVLASQEVQGEPTHYGLGFQVSRDKNGRSFVGHLGNSVGAYTQLYVYPGENKVISILINCSDPRVQGELDDAIASFLGMEIQAVPFGFKG